MKEKKQSKISLVSRFLLVFMIFSLLTLVLLTVIYTILFLGNTKSLLPPNIDISSQDISQNILPLENKTQLTDLELLPPYYSTLTKNFGSFTSHELTTYLRYGEVLKKGSDTKTVSDGYMFLIQNNLNIDIPQIYIDQYVTNEVFDISQTMLNESTDIKDIKLSLDTTQDSVVFTELLDCLSKNTEDFFEGKACETQLSIIDNTEYKPTINFLLESLVTTQISNGNEYDEYINNQQYLYQLMKNSKVNEVTVLKNKTLTNNIYLDLDNTHINKLQLLTNYLSLAYTQLKINDTELSNKIVQLKKLVEYLVTYKYGEDIPQTLTQTITNNNLDLDTENDRSLPFSYQVQFLIKSISINGEIQTFVYPIYIFTSTNSTPIQSLIFTINDNNFSQDYDITPTSQSKGTVRVPIFMYHQITTPPEGQDAFRNGLYVSPLDFEKEMAYLVKKNYKTITPLDYYNLLTADANPTQKTVMLTFDDGVENQYTNAYPILKKYQLTGVFYIISQRSGITTTQRKEMSDNGMVIDSHSATHIDLTKTTDPQQLDTEIISSKYQLQANTGKTVYSIAYPGCAWNSQTIPYVISAGYLLGMSCGNSIDNYPAYRLELSRVHAFGDMNSFVNTLSGRH
jgi:peptidoglycan/xylan/chitin deacetylase (PgdA/CDA1 family)